MRDLHADILLACCFTVRFLGQNCVSAERFYVQEGIYDKFVAAVGFFCSICSHTVLYLVLCVCVPRSAWCLCVIGERGLGLFPVPR